MTTYNMMVDGRKAAMTVVSAGCAWTIMMWQSLGKSRRGLSTKKPPPFVASFFFSTLPSRSVDTTTCCSPKTAIRRDDFPFYFFNTVTAISRCLIQQELRDNFPLFSSIKWLCPSATQTSPRIIPVLHWPTWVPRSSRFLIFHSQEYDSSSSWSAYLPSPYRSSSCYSSKGSLGFPWRAVLYLPGQAQD